MNINKKIILDNGFTIEDDKIVTIRVPISCDETSWITGRITQHNDYCLLLDVSEKYKSQVVKYNYRSIYDIKEMPKE